MRRLAGLCLGLCLAMWVTTAPARAAETLRFVVTPAEAAWAFTGTRSACVLSQRVPDYGEARLSKEAGLGTTFTLTAPEAWFQAGTIEVASATPEWHPGFPDERKLASVAVASDGALWLDDPLASELLVDLYEGRNIALVQAGKAGRLGVSVGVSGVSFRPLFSRYHECTAALFPASFERIARSSLAFAPNDFTLDPDARSRLDLIAAYVRADEHLGKIYIDGHSDGGGAGEHNLELSRRRAEVVADYFAEQRIPNERLVIRYHADRYPIAPNTTAEGRAKNRRATVRLEREGTDDSAVATR